MEPHLACSATSQGRFHYFVLARPAQVSGSIICFGWHQAWGRDLFFDNGRDFIFCGFHAKGKRSVQLIFTQIVCLTGLCCPVSLFFSAWTAGLPGFIIFFGPGRLGWPVSLFIFGIAKNK